MTYLRSTLLLLSLAACGPADKPDPGDTATTGPDDTSAPTTSQGPSTDPPIDDEGFCENYLNPIEPAEPPAGKVGEPYNVGFSSGGDVSGVDWAIETDKLPPGLTFDVESAILAGTPTVPGGYVFSIEAFVDNTDSECPTKPESLTVTLIIAP